MTCIPTSRSVAVSGAILALCLFGCEKKQPGSEPSASGPAPVSAPLVKPSLADHAAKLGFAQYLPVTTELYLGSIHLKEHLEAAKQTAFWKELEPLFNAQTDQASKTPNPAFEAVKKVWGDDFFIALGREGSGALGVLRELSEIYNEATYSAAVGKSFGGAAGGGAATPSQLDHFLKELLVNPERLKQVEDLIVRLKVPTILLGFKVEKADELIQTLISTEPFAGWSKTAKVFELPALGGGSLKCFEIEFRAFLSDEVKTKALESIPDGAGVANLKAEFSKVFEALQQQSVVIAEGNVAGHLVLAVAPDRAHLEFADKAQSSMLVKAESEKLLPYVGKNLLMLSTVDASVQNAMASPQPFRPIMRATLKVLAGTEKFRDLAKKLEPSITLLGDLEKELFQRITSDAVGIGWWEQGVHVESFGGVSSALIDLTKPLQLAPVLGDPAVLFGWDYHSPKPFVIKWHAYLEAWAELLQQISNDPSAVATPQTAPMIAMMKAVVLPEVVNLYKEWKAITEKGLGTEHAFVANLGGKFGALPGLPPEMAEQKILRLVGVHTVEDRATIDSSWTGMEAALKKLMAAIPSPKPVPLPTVISSEKNGVATYFYPIPFATEDLLPCVSLNERILLLGTSKKLNENVAAQLAAPHPENLASGAQWIINFGNIREIVKIASVMAKKPDGADKTKSATHWLSPFETMRGRGWIEDGKRRDSFQWEIHDLKESE